MLDKFNQCLARKAKKRARVIAELFHTKNGMFVFNQSFNSPYSGKFQAFILVRVQVNEFRLAAVACANLPKPSDWYIVCDAVMNAGQESNTIKTELVT